MKSNLFLMTESEKNRILNMHKKATSSHYLGEQAATPTTAPAASTPAPAAAAPTELKSIADIQNFLISKGFDVGKRGADGKIGPDTIAALGKFVAGGAGTAPTVSAEASKTAIAAGQGGTTTTGQTAATAATAAATATPVTTGTTATTPATPSTEPQTQTTNVPLAGRKDIRQQNRQLKQDQRTLNRMGGKMTPQQQQAYQQSIAARTGIGAK